MNSVSDAHGSDQSSVVDAKEIEATVNDADVNKEPKPTYPERLKTYRYLARKKGKFGDFVLSKKALTLRTIYKDDLNPPRKAYMKKDEPAISNVQDPSYIP